ncbi:replication initiation protein [Streptomyces harbinensis]|uniref:replication initiator protein RepSA n=1 Tax=Streptomyces harbinensis TaxID=1176198 RepID=UPI0015902C50|nr:replication initiator protein RepSA [Streptomyces harbinensis]QKV69912.1 replication initiation protein [Streptomyces harbinensis]
MTQTAPTAVPDPITLGDALRVAGSPGFDRWKDQIRRTGGCAQPIHLRGWITTTDRATGTVLHEYSTAAEPGGRLRIACGNRRASRCPSCAYTYAGDTFHLIRAGLTGDERKHVPTSVRAHPKVFTTLTAPSFGAVHNRPGNRPCRCGTHHPDTSPVLGTPLDPDGYDYAGAVLFNNHAGDLWRRFTNRLRREIAARAGLTQTAMREVARVSFGKVAEFQRRGAIHFHAIIRIDGPDGPDTAPPTWAKVLLLTDSIRAAVAHAYTSITIPAAPGYSARVLRWGTQVDVRPIGTDDGEELTEQAVASYLAKYATKAAETTGTLDRRIGELGELDRHDLPAHTRRLITACKDLDPHYPERRLWAWAHMLGFRGHFSTKSRSYSTTLGALRQARADYRARQQAHEHCHPGQGQETTLVLADWAYAGQGHSPGESWLAQTIAQDIRDNRQTARELRAVLDAEGDW